jgi:hypothetical protein
LRPSRRRTGVRAAGYAEYELAVPKMMVAEASKGEQALEKSHSGRHARQVSAGGVISPGETDREGPGGFL